MNTNEFELWVVFSDTNTLEHVGNFNSREEAIQAGWIISKRGNFEVRQAG